MALLHDTLHRFEAKASDDDLKTDLELTCVDCGKVICDIEAGDTLDVLARTADDHTCEDDEDQFITLTFVVRTPAGEEPGDDPRSLLTNDEVMFWGHESGITDKALALGADPSMWA